MEDPLRTIMGILGFAGVGVLLYLIWRQGRNEARLLDQASEALGLYRDVVRSTSYSIEKVNVARGERDGYSVMVTFIPDNAEYQESAMTSVSVEGKTPVVGGTVTLYRSSMADHPGLAKRFPWMAQPVGGFGLRGIDHPWFGLAMAHGSDEQIEHAFNPVVRGLLDQVQRRLVLVSFHEHTMKIQWDGLEEDPSAIERAFRAGVQSLSTLAARP